MTIGSVKNSSRGVPNSHYKANAKAKRLTSESGVINHRNVISATDKDMSQLNTKRSESVYKVAAKRPATLTEVVKTVAGSYGTGEHDHEMFWEPVTPGKAKLMEKKIVSRRLRRLEDLTTKIYNGNASTGDVLDREITKHEYK